MRTITRSTELAAPADLVWAAVQAPQAFNLVAAPLLRYPPTRAAQRPWSEGDNLEGRIFLLGLPLTRHRIRVADIDNTTRTLTSTEGGGPIRTWNHTIHVEEQDSTHCRYTDRIDIDAGPLTRPIAALASLFYHHRQRRWRELAPLLRQVEDARHRTDPTATNRAAPDA